MTNQCCRNVNALFEALRFSLKNMNIIAIFSLKGRDSDEGNATMARIRRRKVVSKTFPLFTVVAKRKLTRACRVDGYHPSDKSSLYP